MDPRKQFINGLNNSLLWEVQLYLPMKKMNFRMILVIVPLFVSSLTSVQAQYLRTFYFKKLSSGDNLLNKRL
jgi:hypothetical protein